MTELMNFPDVRITNRLTGLVESEPLKYVNNYPVIVPLVRWTLTSSMAMSFDLYFLLQA